MSVYVCRYDLRGLLQRQRGTTQMLTEDTIDSSLLFGLCHDITSRPRPSSVSESLPEYVHKSRPTAAFRGRNGVSRIHVFFCFSVDQQPHIFKMLKHITSNEINVRIESLNETSYRMNRRDTLCNNFLTCKNRYSCENMKA